MIKFGLGGVKMMFDLVSVVVWIKVMVRGFNGILSEVVVFIMEVYDYFLIVGREIFWIE